MYWFPTYTRIRLVSSLKESGIILVSWVEAAYIRLVLSVQEDNKDVFEAGNLPAMHSPMTFAVARSFSLCFVFVTVRIDPGLERWAMIEWLCHQQRTMPACTFTLAGQAFYCWLHNLTFSNRKLMTVSNSIQDTIIA